MAIKKNIIIVTRYANSKDPSDSITKEVVMENAYIKVSGVSGVKDSITAAVEIFQTPDAHQSFQTRYYTFIPSVAEGSDNFIKQAYNYLKTLPEFAGGEDC